MIATSATHRLERLEWGQAAEAAAACHAAWESLCAAVAGARITPEEWAANDAALGEDQGWFGQLLADLLRVLYDPQAKQDDMRRILVPLAPYMEGPDPTAWIILEAMGTFLRDELGGCSAGSRLGVQRDRPSSALSVSWR